MLQDTEMYEDYNGYMRSGKGIPMGTSSQFMACVLWLLDLESDDFILELGICRPFFGDTGTNEIQFTKWNYFGYRIFIFFFFFFGCKKNLFWF